MLLYRKNNESTEDVLRRYPKSERLAARLHPPLPPILAEMLKDPARTGKNLIALNTARREP